MPLVHLLRILVIDSNKASSLVYVTERIRLRALRRRVLIGNRMCPTTSHKMIQGRKSPGIYLDTMISSSFKTSSKVNNSWLTMGRRPEIGVRKGEFGFRIGRILQPR